ncbi:MAG: bifunctional oligoribonuclease/PAP phosphatase NrnA, partial [Ignavibacteriales bacterium]|nr:bifunctional oligoribonuclease/PAP phosphatase NrnA [Ignavibacteriales bacterium]
MTEFEACKNIIARSQRFVLTTHVNPDADGLGSELALARYLQRKGKDVHILNHSSTPWNCEFLDS